MPSCHGSLYDRRLNRFLAQSRRTPLVRYLDLPDPPRPLAVEGPLRLLVMISSPAGYRYPPLDVEQEWSLLTDALAAQQEEGQVIVERRPANMIDLRRRLRREAFHVFHFVGHGYYRPDWGDGVLVMEDGRGGPQEVTGEELGSLLNEYDPTRLAVLNACEGARTDASDPFAGVAQSLIQQGLPAVVAMQFEITDGAAIIFAHELYGAIADGYPLEAALAEARGAIRDAGNPTEWGTPVLYSRAPDGHLFHLTTPGKTPNAARVAPGDGMRLIENLLAGRPIREEGARAAEGTAAKAAGPRRPSKRMRAIDISGKPAGPRPQGEGMRVIENLPAGRPPRDEGTGATEGAGAEAAITAEDAALREHAAVKTELLAEAGRLVPVTDVHAARAALRSIEERWEKVGPVPQEAHERLESELRRIENAVRKAEDAQWRQSN